MSATTKLRNAMVTAVIAVVLGGCCSGPEYAVTAPPACPPAPGCPPTAVAVPQAVAPVVAPVATYENPIYIPTADHQAAWEQTVDVVNDYFRIEHEEPIRVLGNVLSEGAITTMPEVSPTIFEPWRRDTVDSDQRWENTLQTMRRRAVVRVIPAPQGGHLVDVQVFKELEDMVQPEHSPIAGAGTFRYDDTFTRIVDPIGGEGATKGWIARGRDTSLEQYMIGDLLSRCGAGAPRVVRGQDPGSKAGDAKMAQR